MSLFTFRRANSDPSRTDAWNTNGHFVVNVAGTLGTNGHCALPKTFTCANGHSGVKNTNGQGPSVPVANGPWRQTGHNRSHLERAVTNAAKFYFPKPLLLSQRDQRW